MKGDRVRFTGRGLSAWTPDPFIAYAYAAKAPPGAVLRAEIRVGDVALAFDPASDGEVVVIGNIPATVSRLVA